MTWRRFASVIGWVDRLFYDYQHEFNEWKRDRQLERRIGDDTLCQGFDDSVQPPEQRPYRQPEDAQGLYAFSTLFCAGLREYTIRPVCWHRHRER
ncbi:MAG: hypothetical protein GPOALKHO_000879 [Sodalis sp.]|nr:MAG: hypothetical protein GPOALKHO_000879 [Sodalis sp.]